MQYFSHIGLILDLIGAIFLAFSLRVINPLEGLGATMKIGGHGITITTIEKGPFIFGILLLIAGFSFQLINLFLNKA